MCTAGITFVRVSTLYDQVDSLQKTPEFLNFLQATRDANISSVAPSTKGSTDWLYSLLFNVDRTLLQHLVAAKSQISNLRGHERDESEAIQQLRARLGQVSETLKVLGVAEQATGARLSRFEARERRDVGAQLDAVRSRLGQQADGEAGLNQAVQELAGAVNRTERREEALQSLHTQVSRVSEDLKTLGDTERASGARIEELRAHETGDIDTRLGGVEAGLARETDAEANISKAVERLFGMERQARHREHALNASEALRQLSVRVGRVSDALRIVDTAQSASVARVREIETQQKEDTDSRFDDLQKSIADQVGKEANASEVMQDLRREVHRTESREQALEQLNTHVDELSEALRDLDSAQNASGYRITQLELYQKDDINKHFDSIQDRLADQMDQEAKMKAVISSLMVKVRKAAHLERGLNVSRSFQRLRAQVSQIAENLNLLEEAQRASGAHLNEFEMQQKREIDSDFEDVHSNLASQVERETNLSKAMQSLTMEVHQTEEREQALQRLSAQVDQMSGFLGELDGAQNATTGRISDLETHEKRDIDAQLKSVQGILAEETEKETNLSKAMQTLMMKVHQVRLGEHKLNASAALQQLNSRVSQISESLKALDEGQRASIARVSGVEAREKQATDSHFNDVRSALAEQAQHEANLSGAMQSLTMQVRQTRRREEALQQLRAQVSQVSGNLRALEGEQNASGARIDEFESHEKRSIDTRLSDVQGRLSRETAKEANLTKAVETLMVKMRQVRRQEHELNASKALQRLGAQVGQLSQTLSVLDEAQNASDARLSTFEVQQKRDADSRFSGLQSRLADEKGEETNLSTAVRDLAAQVHQTEQREQALQQLSAQVEEVSGTLAAVESAQNASGARVSGFEAEEKRSVDARFNDVQARLAGEVEKEGNLTQAVKMLMLKMHEAKRRERDLNASAALQELNTHIDHVSENLRVLGGAQRTSDAQLGEFEASLADQIAKGANLSRAMQGLAAEVRQTERGEKALQRLDARFGRASETLALLGKAQNASGARISELEETLAREAERGADLSEAVQAMATKMHQMRLRERGLNASEALRGLGAQVSGLSEALGVLDSAQHASVTRIAGLEAQRERDADARFKGIQLSLAGQAEKEANLSGAVQGLVAEVRQARRRERALLQLHGQVDQVSEALRALSGAQNASGARIGELEANQARDVDARLTNLQARLAQQAEQETNLNRAVQILMASMHEVRHREQSLNATEALQLLSARVDGVSRDLEALGSAQEASSARIGEAESLQKRDADGRFRSLEQGLAERVEREANLSAATQRLGAEVDQAERREQALQRLSAQVGQVSESLKALDGAQRADGARVDDLEGHQKHVVDAQLNDLQARLAQETDKETSLSTAMQALMAKVHEARRWEHDLNATKALQALSARVEQVSETLKGVGEAQRATSAEIGELEARETHDNATRLNDIHV